MPMEIISKIAVTKVLSIPLFLLTVFQFSQDRIKEESLNNYDEAPGDNFPYAVLPKAWEDSIVTLGKKWERTSL